LLNISIAYNVVHCLREQFPASFVEESECSRFALISSFHEKLYNRSPAHTTPAAGLASSGHVASLATALAAEASLDPR
jgi:hypothetical protein